MLTFQYINQFKWLDRASSSTNHNTVHHVCPSPALHPSPCVLPLFSSPLRSPFFSLSISALTSSSASSSARPRRPAARPICPAPFVAGRAAPAGKCAAPPRGENRCSGSHSAEHAATCGSGGGANAPRAASQYVECVEIDTENKLTCFIGRSLLCFGRFFGHFMSSSSISDLDKHKGWCASSIMTSRLEGTRLICYVSKGLFRLARVFSSKGH